MALKYKRRKKVAMAAVIFGMAITATAGLTACAGKTNTKDLPPETETVNEISAGTDIKEPMTDGMWLNK